MTPDKAIMALTCLYENLEIDKDIIKEAVDVAQNALEKQTPKIPLTKRVRCMSSKIIYYHCPRCKHRIDFEPPYCIKCGQALDWSES